MLRFGQLVVDVLGVDPFYIEDNEARKKFREFGVDNVGSHKPKTDV